MRDIDGFVAPFTGEIMVDAHFMYPISRRSFGVEGLSTVPAAELFGGTAIPNSFYPALDRLNVCFNLLPGDGRTGVPTFVERISSTYVPSAQKRLWWHVSLSGTHRWIGINPGESRDAPPDDSCVVRDAGSVIPALAHQEILREAVEAAQSVEAVGPYENRVREIANKLIRRIDDGPTDDLYDEIRRSAHVERGDDYEAVARGLYLSYFEEFQCPVSTFTDALLLLQLQAASGSWFELDWRWSPAAYLMSLVGTLAVDPDGRRQLFEICESEYWRGKEHLREALAGSMQMMPRHLMLAWHKLFAVHRLLRPSVQAGLDAQTLPIDLATLDETLAYVLAGIQVAVPFILEHPEHQAKRRLLDGDFSSASMSRKASAQSSETAPIFTRLFSDVLSAQALTLSDEGSLIGDGVSALLSLREQTRVDEHALERSWIDLALRKAKRRPGSSFALT